MFGAVSTAMLAALVSHSHRCTVIVMIYWVKWNLLAMRVYYAHFQRFSTIIDAQNRKYTKEHGTEDGYPSRDVRPRYLLGLRDSGSSQSLRVYEKQVRMWQLEKEEKKEKVFEDQLQQRMEKAKAALEEEIFQEHVRRCETLEGRRLDV